MAIISETELQKRLRKLEAAALDPSDTVVLTDDQYTLSENVIYVAYASALSNLVNGTIPNQSDATDFQYAPYNAAGVLMAYRGYFSSTSIYASGDPTDYTWESTSGLTGFTSSERYYTTSTGLLSLLGNPTEPGSGITWTVISSGSAIPGAAVWYAERFTVSGITSGWTITAVGAYVNSSILVDGSVIAAKIAANAVTTAKILNDAIDNDKIAANAVTTTEIAANTIVANNIQADAIGANEIAANAVTADAIAANSVTATEIAGGTITASEIAADAITANAIATDAVTADAITAGTITATEIASNAITSAKVNADAITVDKIDLDGTLNVTAASGAIRWGKDDGDDITNSGLFIGRNSSGDPRFVIGSQSSFIYFNGSLVSIVGASTSATVGTETNIYTNTSSTSTFTISPVLGTIGIELSGGGGGGGCGSAIDGSTSGGAGGASSVVVYKANGSVRTGTGALTLTASGGSGGASGGGPNYTGSAGGSFTHATATEPPFTDATGGAGGTGSGNGSGGAVPSAGGGGAGNPNTGNSAGAGGAVGSYNSTTYTIVDSTDYLVITVGTAGAGGTTTRDNAAGAGARGVVRIKGVLA